MMFETEVFENVLQNRDVSLEPDHFEQWLFICNRDILLDKYGYLAVTFDNIR